MSTGILFIKMWWIAFLLFDHTLSQTSTRGCTSMTSQYTLLCGSGNIESETSKTTFRRLYFRCAERCNLEPHCFQFSTDLYDSQCQMYKDLQTCGSIDSSFHGDWRFYSKIVTTNDCPDPCFHSPCSNSGTCVAVTSMTYTCICTEWKTGINCETNLIGVELVCDWHHGEIYADGHLVSRQTSDWYAFIHRVKIPATTEVVSIFCEDTGVGNDDRAFAVVVLTTGEVTGQGHWSCISSYENGWSDIDHSDSHWQIPGVSTVNSGYWSVNELQYTSGSPTPKWIYLLTQQLYCRLDRRSK